MGLRKQWNGFSKIKNKMFKPILDIFKYIRMFQLYLGVRMYLVYGLGIIASVLEGFGILMLLPLLQSIDNGSNLDENEGIINDLLYGLINTLGLSDSVISTLILISVLFILKGIIMFISLGFTAYLIGQLLKEIKMNLYHMYSNMNYDYFSSKNTGDLINLINEQPTKALEAFKQLSLLGSHFINTFILMTLAFLMTFSFGIMALLLGILLLILFLKMNSYVQNLSRIAAEENGTLTKWLIQSLHGFKYLISTNQINSLKNYINSSIKILTNVQIKSGIAASFTQSVREPIAVLFIMAIVFIQLFIFELRLEPILVSIALFYRSLNSTLAVQSAFQGTFQTIGSMELVHAEFKNQERNRQNDGSISINNFENQILLENINFTYKNSSKQALSSISLEIPSKTSVAFVGGSGAGKTTLVDLITLTNIPDIGILTVDGISFDKIKKETWRKQIGYVSQDTIIFDDTIANNISMWQNSNNDDLDKKLREAANQANILEFIDSLPNGFDTLVGDRGILLSGGQKQRIFIARELFRKPKLLILDEATSALDSESEKSIQRSIELLKGKITVIIIAHRLSTIKGVDKIYLLENGNIIESGSYRELIDNKKSKFNSFAQLQFL